MDDIDFVVTWVDGNDPAWQAEYRKYCASEVRLQDFNRYREWGFFKYWFRAVEKYAPWVHKVILVTNGQVPKWLNLEHPKLRVVTHAEFIPAEYLPTFNSNVIELNLHRIPGLSEHFVSFNDDMYLNNPVAPEYYFRRGLPCDAPREKPINRCYYFNKLDRFGILLNDVVNVAVLNHHFSHKKVIRGNWNRWHGFYMGFFRQILSYLVSVQNDFIGFQTPHVEKPFLKSIYGEPWNYEVDLLNETCLCRFRSELNLTIYYIRYWQLASNKFIPEMHRKQTCVTGLIKRNLPIITDAFHSRRIVSLCLNDVTHDDEEFRYMRDAVTALFEEKHPQKSAFEN